jgi:hypothetical protein
MQTELSGMRNKNNDLKSLFSLAKDLKYNDKIGDITNLIYMVKGKEL